MRNKKSTALTKEQHERQKMAATLHDDLQQTLVASLFTLAEASRSLKNCEFEKVAEALERSKELLKEAICSTRSLATELLKP